MKKKISGIFVTALILGHAFAFTARAETVFVDGYRDGIRVYAIIKHNGTEYRTDQMGPTFNKRLWENLSDEDRKSLISTYSFKIGARKKDFGDDVSGEMADWINAAQGWTDLAENLKNKHMISEYPRITEAFGPDASLDLPDFHSYNPEIINSDDYKAALRLKTEIEADFQVGREVYNMLANARWDQVSIAVKSISGPLIQIMVDNFLTGFVTSGASHFSDLAATAYGFVKDLKDFILAQEKASDPPTPEDLIEKLDQFLLEMAQTAENGIGIIEGKKLELEELAAGIMQAESNLAALYKAEAATKLEELNSRIKVNPEPIIPEFDEEGDIREQALEFYETLMQQKDQILEAKASEINELQTAFSGYFNRTSVLYTDAFQYLAGASDGFSSDYFDLNHTITNTTEWKNINLPSTAAAMQEASEALVNAEAAVNSALDSILPDINDLHAKALGLDQFNNEIGYFPSSSLQLESLRNFDTIVNLVTTEDMTTENIVTQINAELALATLLQDNLANGIEKRRAWINSEWQRYDSLRFNAESSLSHVIAAIRQLDRLHSDPWFKHFPGGGCYDGHCFYRYRIDVDAVNAEINELSTSAEREEARSMAVARLQKFIAMEETLIHRLQVAQNAHVSDIQALENFFRALSSRYPYGYSQSGILEEFRSVTGKTMKSIYDIWNDLVPNITYYFLGDNNWIRNAENEATAFSLVDIENVSGKIPQYYEMLALYDDMRTNKSYYLGLSDEEFDQFMTETQKKVGQAPDGTYTTQFKIRGVWGVEFPCWQLYYKFNNRKERLNSEKRYEIVTDPDTFEVSGLVTGPDGEPVYGIHVFLNGYLNLSTTTRSDGSFVFDFISDGPYTLKVYHEGYEIAANTADVVVSGGNISAQGFVAKPKEDPGYTVSGRLAYENGNPVSNVQVVLTSSSGVEETAVTSVLGAYSFTGLAIDEYTVRPADSHIAFYPLSRTAVVPMSVEDADFMVDRGPGGKIAGDKTIDLADAILAVQISAGIPLQQNINLSADINGDGVIGLEEAIYIFQVISGHR